METDRVAFKGVSAGGRLRQRGDGGLVRGYPGLTSDGKTTVTMLCIKGTPTRVIRNDRNLPPKKEHVWQNVQQIVHTSTASVPVPGQSNHTGSIKCLLYLVPGERPSLLLPARGAG